jgi:hypothetical protein
MQEQERGQGSSGRMERWTWKPVAVIASRNVLVLTATGIIWWAMIKERYSIAEAAATGAVLGGIAALLELAWRRWVE